MAGREPGARRVVGRPVPRRGGCRGQRPGAAGRPGTCPGWRQPPGELGAPYGSDLRLLAGAGIPTLHYGPGDSRLAHAADERVPLAEVHTAARALALLALDVCGLA